MNETARELIERIINAKKALDAYQIMSEVFSKMDEDKLNHDEAELIYKLADDKEQMLSKQEYTLRTLENAVRIIKDVKY